MIKISNINRIIKKIELLPNINNQQVKTFLAKLAELGVDVASVTFSTAQYDGVNDVEVISQWIDDNTIQVVAKGKAVTFIEFGTGITFTEQHPLATKLGAIRGEYGKKKGSKPSWTYYGEQGTNGHFIRESVKGAVYRTKGNPPARAMYQASKEIKNQILKLSREVFK